MGIVAQADWRGNPHGGMRYSLIKVMKAPMGMKLVMEKVGSQGD